MNYPQGKKAAYSWMIYDWANSAFSTTVMAGFFPIFFKKYISYGADVTESTAQLGIANSVGSLLVALSAPILGAISDVGGHKKKFLAFFCYMGVLSTMTLAWVEKGEWIMGAFIYSISCFGHAGSSGFYDALLPKVTTKKNIDYISAAGFAWGYLGGGLLFLINVLMHQHPSWFGLKDGVSAVKWSFISVGFWWGLFALPLFLFINEEKPKKNIGWIPQIKKGLLQLKETFSHLKQHKMIFFFLISFFLYNDGVGTVIKMALDYGMSIGIGEGDLIKALLLVQFVGFPMTLGFGMMSSKFHPKKGIYICIIVYILTIIWAYQMNKSWEFFVLAVLIGCVQGGLQALSRSYFSRLIDLERAGEFYGIYNLLGKFTGIIGPVLMGVMGLVTHSPRLGILSLIILFSSGLLMITFVKESSH